jgi:hypothetical protein
MDFIVAESIKHGGKMNTIDKIINELAVEVGNLTVEVAKYKVLYNEVLEEIEGSKQSLERVNNVLEADETLKELFDEVAEKLEKEN